MKHCWLFGKIFRSLDEKMIKPMFVAFGVANKLHRFFHVHYMDHTISINHSFKHSNYNFRSYQMAKTLKLIQSRAVSRFFQIISHSP